MPWEGPVCALPFSDFLDLVFQRRRASFGNHRGNRMVLEETVAEDGVVKRTFTFELSNMLGTPKKKGRIAPALLLLIRLTRTDHLGVT